jgi:hypothetical protein
MTTMPLPAVRQFIFFIEFIYLYDFQCPVLYQGVAKYERRGKPECYAIRDIVIREKRTEKEKKKTE